MVGLTPTRPEKAAGRRIEPPPSLPSARGQTPAATAAAEPALEPPGVKAVFQGFRVVGKQRVMAEAAVAELGGVGLADDDCVGGLQTLHDHIRRGRA